MGPELHTESPDTTKFFRTYNMSTQTNPPVFSDEKKFNGMNFYPFRTLVLTAVRAHGAVSSLAWSCQALIVHGRYSWMFITGH